MTPPHQNTPDVLSEEILAEARRQCDEIIRQAQAESASLLAAATAEAERIRREKLDSARAEAARRSELTLAAIPVETGRMRSARIEAILENIRETALQRLLARNFDGRETVVALAAEALRRMPGTHFVLKISTADHGAGGDRLAEEICQRAGRPSLNLIISADPAISDGGVIVESAEGTQIWDNRLTSRLERLWPELRRQIALQTSLVEKNQPAGGAA